MTRGNVKKTTNKNVPSNMQSPDKVAALAALQQYSPQRMHKYAKKMLDPLGEPELVFPAPLPGRAGSATFPLTIEIENDGDFGDFGVVISPNTSTPVKVTHQATQPFVELPYFFAMSFHDGEGGPYGASGRLNDLDAHAVQTTTNKKYLGLPLVIEEGVGPSQLVDINMEIINVAGGTWGGTLQMFQYRGTTGEWISSGLVYTTTAGGGNKLYVTGLTVTERTLFTFVLTTGPGHTATDVLITGQISANNPGGPKFKLSDEPVGNVMQTYAPDWDSLLANASEVRVVAATALLTSMSSAIVNGGAAAACNAPSDLPYQSSWYETCARRPFDRYDGRLASEGNADGGLHWHYVPDSLNEITMVSPLKLTQSHMTGYFGIKGMPVGGSVRISCAFTLNYFSVDPSYPMVFQPPLTDFSPLIAAMRMNVPLVTSNDSHTKKIKGLAKTAVRHALRYIADNPQFIAQGLALL